MPGGLAARGRRFWRFVTGNFELDRPEIELLVEVCRLLDTTDALAAAIRRDGHMIAGASGQPRVNGAITELRNAQLALSRLLAALALPAEDGSTLASPARIAARQAAGSRWAGPRPANVSDQ